MTRFVLVLIMIGLFSISTVSAQDVATLVAGETFRYEPTSGTDQFFGTFSGESGDVVYLTADYEGFVTGSISIDLRDSVGRSVGTKDEYLFREYIIAEIPEDGTYTVVANIEEPEPVNILVGVTTYINEEPFEVTLTEEGFPFFFAIRLEDTAEYTVQMDRLSGDLGVDLQLLERGRFFNDTVLTLGGTRLITAQGSVELSSSGNYVGIISRALISDGNFAEVAVSLSNNEN